MIIVHLLPLAVFAAVLLHERKAFFEELLSCDTICKVLTDDEQAIRENAQRLLSQVYSNLPYQPKGE